MSALTPYLAALAVLTALALRRHWARRDVLLHAAIVLTVLVLAADPMGLPKPAWLEWREVDGERVHAVQYHPGEAIYIWTFGPPPRVYALPWSPAAARAMQQTLADGRRGVIYRSGERWIVRPIDAPPVAPKRPD